MKYAILFAIFSTVVVYAVEISPKVGERLLMERQILSGTARSPYRYRVLKPVIGKALQQTGLSHIQAYTFMAFLSFVGAYYFFGKLLSKFNVNDFAALAGLTMLSLCIPLSITGQWQGGDWIELFIYALGLCLILERKYVWLYCLLFVGMTNRDATVFLVAFLAVDVWKKKDGKHDIAVALFVCIATFIALRIYQGYIPNPQGVAYALEQNAANLSGAILFTWSAIVICPFAVAFWNYRNITDARLKRWMWLLIPYTILFVMNALVWELAKFLPAYLIVIPAILSTGQRT